MQCKSVRSLRSGEPFTASGSLGDLASGFSDLEMTWILYCAGAATEWHSFLTHYVNVQKSVEESIAGGGKCETCKLLAWSEIMKTRQKMRKECVHDMNEKSA